MWYQTFGPQCMCKRETYFSSGKLEENFTMWMVKTLDSPDWAHKQCWTGFRVPVCRNSFWSLPELQALSLVNIMLHLLGHVLLVVYDHTEKKPCTICPFPHKSLMSGLKAFAEPMHMEKWLWLLLDNHSLWQVSAVLLHWLRTNTSISNPETSTGFVNPPAINIHQVCSVKSLNWLHGNNGGIMDYLSIDTPLSLSLSLPHHLYDSSLQLFYIHFFIFIHFIFLCKAASLDLNAPHHHSSPPLFYSPHKCIDLSSSFHVLCPPPSPSFTFFL